MFQTTKPSNVTLRSGLKLRQNSLIKKSRITVVYIFIDFETENIDITKLVPISTAQNGISVL